MAVQRSAPAYMIGAKDNPPPFTPIKLKGTFVPSPVFRLLAKPYHGHVGEWLTQYFKAENGQYYMIKLGWVPKGNAITLPSKTLTLEGHVMPQPTTNMFTPANDAARHAWYTLDIKAFGAAAHIPRQAPFYILNRSFVAEGLTVLPLDVSAANNHFQYMLTWGMLALMILLGLIIALRSKNCGHSNNNAC